MATGLNHDFLLVDRQNEGEWHLTRFIHDPRCLHLHDDVVWYMYDTMQWIPTKIPVNAEPNYHGLNMYGPTLIEAPGAAIAHGVFIAWANLFANGPATLKLTLHGGTLELDRRVVVPTLNQIADWCATVRDGHGRWYLYHGGV